jgi:hypothetical protein
MSEPFEAQGQLKLRPPKEKSRGGPLAGADVDLKVDRYN